MNTQYFVNHKTRLCRILGGRGAEHDTNVNSTLRDGFVEVAEEAFDEFREDTQKARAAGWNPDGRISYAKFIEKHSEHLKAAQP